MIYNKYRKALYNNIKEAAKCEDGNEERIINGLKSGIYLYVPYKKLEEYRQKGII